MTALPAEFIYEALNGEPSAALERVASDTAIALQPFLPATSFIQHRIREVGTDYFSFDFKVRLPQRIKPLAEFSAEFLTADRSCVIYRINVDAQMQGRGLGRALLAAVMASSYREGFMEYDVSTSDAGSYFWARQAFRAEATTDIRRRLHARINRLEPVLPASLLDRATRLVDSLGSQPENLRLIAGLQHKRFLKECFAIASTPLPCSLPEHVLPSLGQVLLIGTAWDGVARLHDAQQRAQVFGALGITR